MNQSENSQADRHPALRGKGILFVEDYEDVRRFVGRFLRKSGYAVFHASSPEEAVVLWKEHGASIDLLFTDVGAGGVRLTETLIARAPELKVLFTSGSVHGAVAAMCAKNPSCRFLQKPYSSDELKSMLGKMLP